MGVLAQQATKQNSNCSRLYESDAQSLAQVKGMRSISFMPNNVIWRHMHDKV
jgi:hypothetical protein